MSQLETNWRRVTVKENVCGNTHSEQFMQKKKEKRGKKNLNHFLKVNKKNAGCVYFPNLLIPHVFIFRVTLMAAFHFAASAL